MKILFICHRLPYRPDHGGRIRAFNMIRHLSRRHRVVVACLASSADELHQGQGLRDHGVELIAELLPPALRWRQACAVLPTTLPSSAAYFWSAQLRRRIDETAARASFDVVIVHCAFMGRYADQIPSRLRV